MKVLFTHNVPYVAEEMLKKEGIEVTILNKNAQKTDILKAIKKEPYDGMVTWLTDHIDKEIISSVGSKMQIISNYAVGFGNIDIDYAKEKNIIVTNTPGVLTDTVAEHVIALILGVSTRIIESDDYMREGRFKGWGAELLLGLDLKDKTLGILGAGRIGTKVAKLATAFGMNIIYHDKNTNLIIEEESGAVKKGSPEDLISQSDVLSIHLPLNKETYHFLDERKLALLKSSSILINTSRGAVIKEEVLVKILKEEKIFGAALDVFENEPKIPKDLLKLPNVILTPHTASASIQTRDNMAIIVANNIISVLHGGKPTTPVF